jgi:hypothetical protein
MEEQQVATNDDFDLVDNSPGQVTNATASVTPLGANGPGSAGPEEDADTPDLADTSGTGGGLSSGISSGLFGPAVAGPALDEVGSAEVTESSDEDAEELRGKEMI